MKNWIQNIFSLEERKASTLMTTYIVFCGVGVYLLYKTGNIPSPLSYIIISLAGLIAGVNLIPNIISSSGQNSTYGNYNYNQYSNYMPDNINNINDNIQSNSNNNPV